MNRITALINSCEDRLKQIRQMMDELDTHVAGKTLLAYLMTYICIIGSVSKSQHDMHNAFANKNLPVLQMF